MMIACRGCVPLLYIDLLQRPVPFDWNLPRILLLTESLLYAITPGVHGFKSPQREANDTCA